MYDLAIVGSGIACSMALCQLAESMKSMPAQDRSLRIAIIEKEGEMWNGIPYGRRSTAGALTFQKLEEFLQEPERTDFIRWLTSNSESWLETFKEFGGPGAARWLSDNQSVMDRGDWGELYLPRFLFGLYVSGQAARAVENLSGNLATVTLIHGEATAIFRIASRHFNIAVEKDDSCMRSIHAAEIVLAIGSPPLRSIHIDNPVAESENHTHIADLYSPSEDINIERIQQVLSSLPDKALANILIVGSNASALEVLYLIAYRPDIRNLVNSVVILSRSGLLPYKISEANITFELTAMGSLAGAGEFLACDLMSAITADIRRAEQLGVNVADLRDSVGASVSHLIASMHISEQEKFICQYGVHYSRMMRRAGRDTRNAADQLADLGILTAVKGEFRRLEPLPSGRGLMFAAYATVGSQDESTYPVPFSISINCGGFEELDVSSSRLINSLISNKLCKVNSTKRGFAVNEKLEASEGVYVIGPLIGGNFNDKIRYWHVESASRIVGLAKLLAESLLNSLFPSIERYTIEKADLSGAAVSGVCLPFL